MAFAKTLDTAMGKFSNKEFKGMVVILATKEQGKSIEQMAPMMNKELKNVSISYLTADNDAVKNYKINTGAKNTVFVYKNWEVKDKFVDLTADEKGLNSLNAAIGNIVK